MRKTAQYLGVPLLVLAGIAPWLVPLIPDDITTASALTVLSTTAQVLAALLALSASERTAGRRVMDWSTVSQWWRQAHLRLQ